MQRKLSDSTPKEGGAFRVFAIVIALIGSWGFVEISDDIGDAGLERLELVMLKSLRVSGDVTEPVGPEWLEEAARDVTALGSFPVLALIVLGAFVFLLLAEKKRAAAYVLYVALSGTVVSTLLKLGFDRLRPEAITHQTQTFTKSFPSGHAFMSAVIFFSLAVLVASSGVRRSLKVFTMCLAVLLTVVVGLTRLYLGVHWPTDVLGGWMLGASWVTACWLLMSKWLLAESATLGYRGRAANVGKLGYGSY